MSQTAPPSHVSWWTLGALTFGVIGLQYKKDVLRWLTRWFTTTVEATTKNSSFSNESSKEETCANSSAEFIRKHPKGFGRLELLSDIQVLETRLLPIPHLTALLGDESDCRVLNERDIDTGMSRRINTYNRFMTDSNVILGDIRRHPTMSTESRAYLRAGPRKYLYFEPKQVKAAIVTCGGLCPGLNNVIRDITLSLWNLYGVRTIYGIRGGYGGFYDWKDVSDPIEKKRKTPLMLTPKAVSGIHHMGGTILQSNRGGFDVTKILDFVHEFDITQVYIIGGDGTHRGADLIAKEAVERGLRVAVAGIPKTIDNDVDLLDRSFGFNTSVEEAQRAIRSAKTEARCVPNGVGIVKLMGRSSGFIAAHATLSSGDVDLCLVPEVPIELEGPEGCLPHIERTLKVKGNAVIVVAEGAGEELLGVCTETDAGGNKKLPPIGAFLKQKVLEYFAQRNQTVTVKYIDPSYMIRSVKANAADSLYCMLLAQNAVHGAMAGYTGFTVGLCCNRVVYLPISAITRNSPRCMDALGRTWERVLCMTRQPNPTYHKPHSGAITSNPPL